MNKASAVLFAAIFVSTAAFAADDMKHQGMMKHMKSIDSNGDGMISKKEFTKHHENMWTMMKKTKSGMVDMKEMEKMHADMMKDGGMKKDGMMKDKMGK